MMAIVYTWEFPQLEYAPAVDGMSRVVETVHWRLIAADGSYSAETYGTVALPSPQPQEFVDFDELTPELVQSWTEAAIGADAVAKTKDNLVEQISIKKQPPVVIATPPWNEGLE